MDYGFDDLLRISGLSETYYRQLVARGQLVLSDPTPGTGRARRIDGGDIFQATLFAQLGQVGISPRFTAKIWPLVVSLLHHDNAMVLMAPRPDRSGEMDVRVVLPGQDGGLERLDAPAVLTTLNVGGMKRQVCEALADLENIP